MTMSSLNSSWSHKEGSDIERMLRPQPISAAAVAPEYAPGVTVSQLSSSSSSSSPNETMDLASRMRAIKVFNVILIRLWRRRSAEVCNLHERTRKASTIRGDPHRHDKILAQEQRRCNRLELELRQSKYSAELSMESYARMENTLNATRRKEAKLRRDLQTKTLECDSLAESLNITRTEMFRELSKFRQCAQDLAAQQRLNRILEGCNAELEDKLLTLKDLFQTQHDEIALAFNIKQEKIDEAYEVLKACEQELAELELNHIELLKEIHSDAILQKIAKTKRNAGIVRYVYCYINTLGWRINFRWLSYEIFAQVMAIIMRIPMSEPALPTKSLGVCVAVVLLISLMY